MLQPNTSLIHKALLVQRDNNKSWSCFSSHSIFFLLISLTRCFFLIYFSKLQIKFCTGNAFLLINVGQVAEILVEIKDPVGISSSVVVRIVSAHSQVASCQRFYGKKKL